MGVLYIHVLYIHELGLYIYVSDSLSLSLQHVWPISVTPQCDCMSGPRDPGWAKVVIFANAFSAVNAEWDSRYSAA
jgi:hypothetical protein